MSTDFQKLLFDISESLVTTELASLKFLSLEYISMRQLEDIQNAQDFFEALQENGMIEAGNLSFLKELLYCISRIDLLAAHLSSSREEVERELKVPGRAQVSAYRQLLYGIAEDLTQKDVQNVKFLLRERIPKSKLQDNASMLKVFLEMERNGIIKEDDITTLKDIFKGFRADIKKKIDTYEERKDSSYGCLALLSYLFSSFLQLVESYKMKNNPHGYCLILNNYKFKNPDEAREGTVKDGEAVKTVFKWLQFETVEHMDLEAKQMYAIIEEYSNKDHSNMDCFVCFIFSHGEKDKIKGVDNEVVNIKDLLSCFTGSNCPSLAGKPKLFFIQACQGSVGHPAVIVKEDFSGHFETDATPQISIPDQADILVGMATVEDYECYRSIETGSVYIQCLCDKMKLLCPLSKDLITILTEVNKEVGRIVIKQRKQMPKITSTLRKQLIFQIPPCPSIEK
ncbi:CASP8 protein, partial [Psilopogon haemacephalus]|nr:CASP8 protein [Psilopogon haemacephalus]